MSDPVVTVDPIVLDSTGQAIVTKLEAIKTAIQNGGGGGGTTVVANPSGTATDDLEKLQVGSTIYAIPVTEIEVTPIQQSGTKIATIEIDGTEYDFYAPNGGGGGDTVSWTQIQATGTKIATITINNVPTDVYVPAGGGGGDTVTWTQIQQSGTKIAEISINGSTTNVYAPNNGGGGGSSVTTDLLFTARESVFHTDNADTPVNLDTRTTGTDYSSYLSYSSQNYTYTVLQNFAALVTLGVEQDPNQSSASRPNCAIYVNDVLVYDVDNPDTTSGSTYVASPAVVMFFTGDEIFFGSKNSSGWAIRMAQIDILDGYDLSNYTKPAFPTT